MRKKLAVFLTTCLCYTNSLSAAETPKLYIDSEDISFENNTIAVYANNEWVPVNALYTDSNGFYVLKSAENTKLFCYDCWYCKYPIPAYKSQCPRCGLKQ